MRTNGYVILAVVAAVFASGCETMQQALDVPKPRAQMTGLKFDNITVDSATLLFDVEVENPYPVALPLVNVDYGLTSRSKSLFAGKADLQTTVPAESKKSVSLPATINYMDLIEAFKGIRPGSKIPYQADLGLSVNTPALGVIRLPLKKQGELSVPAVPKLSEFDWEKTVLTKVPQP
ncbi:MAG TPA: LEA type 2 family protein [Sedimentisphaerales bacterium]|nr:LEA type 2 family protein [Sedimentisphaerales bacterium]